MSKNVTLFWWPSWQGCRKAREYLSQLEIEFEERDFFKQPFTESDLMSLLKNTPLSDVFSWRSPSFKAMGLDQGSLTDDDLIRLMLEEPRLIRRPIVKINDKLIIGASPKLMDAEQLA